jgi:urease accessory protein
VRAFGTADGAALVHLHNLSGGVLGGDDLEIEITVGPEARAQLTSTGATRLYRSREDGCAARQTMTAHVGENGLLEYLPDSLIPFAGSRYRQDTRIELVEGAGLFWWEIVAPGREARGEIWACESLCLRTDIVAGGRPIALERIAIEPRRRPLHSLARLGPYRYFATFFLCRVGWEARRWQALEAALDELARDLTRPGELLWGVSALPAHGLSVRALAVSGRELPAGLVAFWRAAKREIYGRDAIPPRKVY